MAVSCAGRPAAVDAGSVSVSIEVPGRIGGGRTEGWSGRATGIVYDDTAPLAAIRRSIAMGR